MRQEPKCDRGLAPVTRTEMRQSQCDRGQAPVTFHPPRYKSCSATGERRPSRTALMAWARAFAPASVVT